jgi:hypothetical protein
MAWGTALRAYTAQIPSRGGPGWVIKYTKAKGEKREIIKYLLKCNLHFVYCKM